jgi:mycofactocin precursor
MDSTATVEPDTRTTSTDAPVAEVAQEPVVEQDLLVEDVSIDGMCGVY